MRHPCHGARCQSVRLLRALLPALLGYALGYLAATLETRVPVTRHAAAPEPRYWVVLDGAPACMDLGSLWVGEEE